MKEFVGDPQFPVWLIGDSEPRNWRQSLLTPLDPRHPARHNIWTPVVDYMQDVFYRSERLRFDAEKLYIRNAITDPNEKPNGLRLNWTQSLQDKANSLGDNFKKTRPNVVLTFGAFAFEFVRRACGEGPDYPYAHWGTRELGNEFRKHIGSYNPARLNILPLLHVSISRGKFLESHKYYVGTEVEDFPNYFQYVGGKVAKLFLQRLLSEPIWVK